MNKSIQTPFRSPQQGHQGQSAKSKSLATFVVAMALTSPSYASITLVDTLVATSEVEGLNYSAIDASGLTIAGASKLVVTVGSEGAQSNGSDPGSIGSLSYGGTALTLIDFGDNGRSSVWYLDLAGAMLTGTDIDLVFLGDNGQTDPNVKGYGLSAYTLGNTVDGVSSFGSEKNVIVNVSPATAGEFLIASYSRNNNHSPATPVTAGLVELYDVGQGGGGLVGYTAASIYHPGLTNAGAQDIQIDGMNGSGATVIATFAEAVPEPTTTALLGLGGLALILRRRK